MLILSGASMVLPDRVVTPGWLAIQGDRIVDVREGVSPGQGDHDLSGYVIVPGFIDVHVHGIEGYDVLDGPLSLATIARRLPRYGVTAFCPTTVACAPAALRMVLDAIRAARIHHPAGAARVLPGHLESNFLSPAFRGAQPLNCLRLPPLGPDDRFPEDSDAFWGSRGGRDGYSEADFTGADIVAEIERAAPDIGIVTVAPELPGGLDLIARLTGLGLRVSVGHSGAGYEEGCAAISAGARHATHLFNRMPPLRHRDPGLVGAVLAHEDIATEIICDGLHVHPAVIRTTVAAKSPSRVMAITDATAAAGLSIGSIARLGGQPIVARPDAAYLEDGTLAGSTCTMDRALRILAGPVGLDIVAAVRMCATTPARELGLSGYGAIAPGAVADLTVLSADLQVIRTYIGGELAFSA